MFHVFQALSIFVLVNDLYIGDPLEANKLREYAYSSKILLINTLNRIPQSKPMRIMPRGHIVTDPSTFSYFITLA